MEELKILVLDDEKRLRDEIGEYLKKRHHEVFLSTSASDTFQLLENTEIDIAILDIRLPEMSGLEVLRRIKLMQPSVEVIMISGHGDMATVIEAMRNGAIDYFPKPFRMHDVQNAIERTQKFILLNKKLQQSEQTISILTHKLYQNMGSPMIGQSKSIQHIIEMMERVAASDQTNVLITGESGTGKELVAHGIHLLSIRKKNAFHSVNCSAITDSLFESEFFGHKKGSFTGAYEDRSGCFEVASKGTLFLDEIGDMPLGQQAKLLRTLEDRKVRPVGGRNAIDVDVRVIAASNQLLEQMIEEKKFRSDLYHRLSTFIIDLPPLRDRIEDIPLLANHFIELFAKRMNKGNVQITDDALDLLLGYSYPGNIRELRNIIERALILCDGNHLLPNHFPFLDKHILPIVITPEAESSLLENNEYKAVMDALQKTNYNKSKAAALLNISWNALHRRMTKFGIESSM